MALFLYFGLSGFSWKKVHVPNCQPISIDKVPDFHHQVQYDMIHYLCPALFNTKGKEKWSSDSLFVNIPETNVWVYQHSDYIQASNAKFTNFNVIPCRRQASQGSVCQMDDHNILETCLKDNAAIMKRFPQVSISSVAFESPYYVMDGFDTMTKGIFFPENVWTKRLYGAIKSMDNAGFQPEYTAEDGKNFIFSQNKVTGLPRDDYYCKCFLFRGSSDITLKRVNVTICNKYDSADEDDVSSSDEESIEIGKQIETTKHEFPQKLGELLACMYISAMKKVLKCLLIEKNVQKFQSKEFIVVHGLYIAKHLGTIQCSIQIPIINVEFPTHDCNPVINIEDYAYEALSADRLCSSIRNLVDITRFSD